MEIPSPDPVFEDEKLVLTFSKILALDDNSPFFSEDCGGERLTPTLKDTGGLASTAKTETDMELANGMVFIRDMH